MYNSFISLIKFLPSIDPCIAVSRLTQTEVKLVEMCPFRTRCKLQDFLHFILLYFNAAVFASFTGIMKLQRLAV